jgi:hypothetical protein
MSGQIFSISDNTNKLVVVKSTDKNKDSETEQKIKTDKDVKLVLTEDLDPNTVTIHNIIIRNDSKDLKRILPIKNKNDKKYYVITETLEPQSVLGKSVFRTKSDTKYIQYIFSLKYPEVNSQIDTMTNSHALLEKLNKFKRGITNRMKYLMKIPEFSDKSNISMLAKTIYLNDSIILSNIIEYKGMRNNFSFGHLKQILKVCRYKLLIRIDGLDISDKDVYLQATLVRVYPENIDALDSMTKITMLESLNTSSMKNMQRYSELNHIEKNKRTSKKNVKSELTKLLTRN